MQINSYLGGNVEHIKVGDHTKDVQAYLDYYAIVGDDDNGSKLIWIIMQLLEMMTMEK